MHPCCVWGAAWASASMHNTKLVALSCCSIARFFISILFFHLISTIVVLFVCEDSLRERGVGADHTCPQPLISTPS